ncbi:amidohydrolase family protein [Jatrophihabitans sp.]|uniref:N-acyl-D-amino-acid deacylase family protein n=1 Tax=Jatrophihabitans sp. TaxID=1932789 RepID=UPI0030C6F81B|nr:amidohydrolase [Jatrophihabitans sp.]
MPEFDLVVRGGTIVDGDGGLPVTGDVAISGGVIREVGAVSGRGSQEIAADGAIVTPGWVDMHTHYDAQATWSERLAPSSWHGVTTVVMGNCGVGFAPAKESDQTRLVELMEGVEDIPGVVMTEGLTWDWSSFPDFLDVLSRRSYDIDLAAQVPHAPLRVHAMGERAAAYAQATDDDIAVMGQLVREAVAAGAVGFSTSRSLNHRSVNGEITPSYEASGRELIEIARAMGQTGKGVLQLVTDYPDVDSDLRLMRDMASASGRPLSVTLTHKTSEPERYLRILAGITAANQDGLVIRGQVPVRGIGLLLGLQCSLNPFAGNPVYRQLADLPVPEQARRMADPQLKAEILAAQTSDSGKELIGGQLIQLWHTMFPFADPPDYEPHADTSVLAVAERTGRAPQDVAYDMLLGEGGYAMLYLPGSGYPGTLDVVRELLTHPHTVPSLSDGGAHVGTICDASFPTTMLQHWVRDRDHDRLDLAYAVSRQARDTAHAVGMFDRGRLVPGLKADLNVIDLDALRLHIPRMVYDLPGGGKRLMQRVEGYRHTIVSGVETYRDAEATGALPGRLVRS